MVQLQRDGTPDAADGHRHRSASTSQDPSQANRPWRHQVMQVNLVNQRFLDSRPALSRGLSCCTSYLGQSTALPCFDSRPMASLCCFCQSHHVICSLAQDRGTWSSLQPVLMVIDILWRAQVLDRKACQPAPRQFLLTSSLLMSLEANKLKALPKTLQNICQNTTKSHCAEPSRAFPTPCHNFQHIRSSQAFLCHARSCCAPVRGRFVQRSSRPRVWSQV